MGQQEIELNDKKRLEFDIMEILDSCVVVICDGKAKIRDSHRLGNIRL